MKKKVLIAFLSMSMLGTSLAPVSAAEFTSGEEAAVVQEQVEPDLTIDDFSEGDSEETPVIDDGTTASDTAKAYNYEDDEEVNIKSIHIIKQPTKNIYYYGLHIKTERQKQLLLIVMMMKLKMIMEIPFLFS